MKLKLNSLFCLFFLQISIYGIVMSQGKAINGLNIQIGHNLIEYNWVVAYSRMWGNNEVGIGLKYHIKTPIYDFRTNLYRNQGYAKRKTLEPFGIDLNYSRFIFCREKFNLRFNPYIFSRSQFSKMSLRKKEYKEVGSINHPWMGQLKVYGLYDEILPDPLFSWKTSFGLGGVFLIIGNLSMDLNFGAGFMLIQEKGYFKNGKGWVLALNGPCYGIGLRYRFK